MNTIFEGEDQIIAGAEALLSSVKPCGTVSAGDYGELLDEYRKLLKQVRRVVRMSDLMQSELNRLSRKLEHMSTVDALTDLYNRRFFNEFFQKEWDSAIRSGTSLSILMIDVDLFKKYNDFYGHLMGDTCLQSIAGALKEVIKRPRDTIARYGGEEFVALLPETDRPGATTVAENLLENVRNLNIPHAMSPDIGRISISIGVAVGHPTQDDNPADLLNAADEALYRAKDLGRDRWCNSGDPATESQAACWHLAH